MSRWLVRYLTHYKDMNRWGETSIKSLKEARQWVTKADTSILTIEVYFCSSKIEKWDRNKRGKLVRST